MSFHTDIDVLFRLSAVIPALSRNPVNPFQQHYGIVGQAPNDESKSE